MGRLKVSKSRIRTSKYPWERWLKAGTSHTLTRGKDFEISSRNFVINLYQWIRSHDDKIQVKVEYLKDDKGVRLVVTKLKGRKSA